MGGSSQSYLRRRGWIAFGGLLVTASVLALFLSFSNQANNQASAASGGGPEMGLNVISWGGCDASVRPTTCDVPVDGDFTLAIDLLEAPLAGYIGWGTWLTFPTDLSGIGTIVWPDAKCSEVFVLPPPGTDHHGCITGLIDPPVSTFEGTLVELDMTCSTAPTQNKLRLLPHGDPIAGTSGTSLTEPDGTEVTTPKLNSLTINCVEPLSEPGDTDGDGCSDQKELGLDKTLGGQRSFVNPWDFYDVAVGGGAPGQDGYIDLFNDIAGVIDHYAPNGVEPEYDKLFDRGPSAGPFDWNMTAPDGRIDLFNDIAGVISQAGHDCG